MEPPSVAGGPLVPSSVLLLLLLRQFGGHLPKWGIRFAAATKAGRAALFHPPSLAALSLSRMQPSIHLSHSSSIPSIPPKTDHFGGGNREKIQGHCQCQSVSQSVGTEGGKSGINHSRGGGGSCLQRRDVRPAVFPLAASPSLVQCNSNSSDFAGGGFSASRS